MPTDFRFVHHQLEIALKRTEYHAMSAIPGEHDLKIAPRAFRPS